MTVNTMKWQVIETNERPIPRLYKKYLGINEENRKMKKNMNSIFERKVQKASHPIKKYSNSLVVEL